jgi:hypothetical protein
MGPPQVRAVPKPLHRMWQLTVTARHSVEMEILQSCGLLSKQKTKLKKRRKGLKANAR